MQGQPVLLLRPRLLHDVVITSRLKCVLYVAQINNVNNGSWKINKESDTTRKKDYTLLVFFFQSYMQLHYYWTKEYYKKSLHIPMIFFFVLVN